MNYCKDSGFYLEESHEVIVEEDYSNFIPIVYNQSVLDLGCGHGTLIKHLFPHCSKVTGYDGYPGTPELTNGLGHVADLSQRQNFGMYDWVFSIEVGEHIPKQFEKNFLHNLTSHAKTGIILSWAEEEQDGIGHVNCRSQEYLQRELYKLKFLHDVNKSWRLRRKCKTWWLYQNLQVYYRVDSLEVNI